MVLTDTVLRQTARLCGHRSIEDGWSCRSSGQFSAATATDSCNKQLAPRMLDRDRDGLLQHVELMGLARLMGFNFSEEDWQVEYQQLCSTLAKDFVKMCAPETDGFYFGAFGSLWNTMQKNGVVGENSGDMSIRPRLGSDLFFLWLSALRGMGLAPSLVMLGISKNIGMKLIICYEFWIELQFGSYTVICFHLQSHWSLLSSGKRGLIPHLSPSCWTAKMVVQQRMRTSLRIGYIGSSDTVKYHHLWSYICHTSNLLGTLSQCSL